MKAGKNTYYLEGIANRDSKVISEIYKDILPGIISWIRQNGGQEDDAKDLFQEMIVSIYKKLKAGEFELTCKFWSYALVVCRNLWFAKIRKTDRISYVEQVDDDRVEISPGMQEEIEQKEQLKLYRKHFQALSESCQKVLSLFFAKVKMAEIAEKMDSSEGYIKKKKFKCKEELVNKIKADPLFAELTEI
ncbi:RNA polymerase sigma factor [Portibacter marinus]|uniref:RNA polymerase sigma factor n=1 Tax=Portibacter marinus TaxID=2898660 RepID=UPI001F32F549|nr:sigma-70 family RNA polymerase sigma factor [Portibacter marinus]